jgi:hypothetical protein
MTQIFQPGQHPDADQLNAFVEHSLPLHEQQQTLAHLATCSDCRAIVYLSQAASLDEFAQPQPIATHKPWFSGWNLFSGWTLAWPAAAALACLILVTIHLRNAGQADHKDAADKTARLEQTPPPLRATPPPAQTVPPKAAPPDLEEPQAVVPPAAGELDGRIATNAINAGGASKRKSLNSPLEKQRIATGSTDALKFESAATASRQSSLGMVSSARFAPANPVPATAAMGRSVAVGRSTQTVTVTGDAVVAQQNADSASAAAAPQRTPSSPTTLHSLNQQYNAAPPASAPMAPPPALPGSVNETVSVTSAAPVIETEPTASSGIISGAAFGSLQSNESLMAKQQPVLPSHLPTLSTALGARLKLAIDTAGALFRSEDAGVTWQPVAAQWKGRAVRVALTISPNRQKVAKDASAANQAVAVKTAPAVPARSTFELTNDTGDLWISSDGQTWTRK